MDDVLDMGRSALSFKVLEHMLVMTVRHAGEGVMPAQVRALGLDWPKAPGTFTGPEPFLAWRSPREVIGIAAEALAAPLHALLQATAPGVHATAVGVDLSDAICIFDLRGPGIDDWLERLVDSSAVPRRAGAATRCRLADTAVMLLRLDAAHLWLLADVQLEPDVSAWLQYALPSSY